MTERLIESKKPWATAALIGLLLSAVVSFIGGFVALSSFDDKLYADAFRKADQARDRSTAAADSLGAVVTQQTEAVKRQDYLLAVQSRRFQWLDLLRAVESSLPHDNQGDNVKIEDRLELYIDRMECQYVPDLSTWFARVKKQWKDSLHHEAAADHSAAEAEGETAEGTSNGDQSRDVGGATMPPEEAAMAANENGETEVGEQGPKGGGWVIELMGHHYHNEDQHQPNVYLQFVQSTLIKSLMGDGEDVLVSAGPRAGDMVPVSELGIRYPVIVAGEALDPQEITDESLGSGGEAGNTEQKKMVRPYKFVVQFVWQPNTPGGPKSRVAEPSDGME